jgi:hypothetical protein
MRMTEVADLLDTLTEEQQELFDIYVPEYYTEFSRDVTVKNKAWDKGTPSYEVDREKSLARIAAISAALPGRKDKVMDEDGLKLVITTPSGASLTFTCAKEVTCTKKVVGKKWVEPYTPAPREGHYEDIVEYECDEIVLLKHKA